MSDSDDASPTPPAHYTLHSKRNIDVIPRPVKKSKHTTSSVEYGRNGRAEDQSASNSSNSEWASGLTGGSCHDEDEVRDDKVEELLNNFIQVHPMCGAAFNSNEAMHILSKLPPKGQIPDMQVVPRSYDNTMLRPPDEAVGERPCANDKQCFCYYLGKLRHGENDPRAFVCTEYLLPKEQTAWRNGRMRLPECRKKCLICTRYYLHAMVLRIKTEKDFHASLSGKMLQEFRNEIGTHTCSVETNDGYPESRLLSIVPEEGVDEPVVMFPFVGFNTKNYKFVLDAAGKPYAVQLNMVPRSDLNGRPSSE